MKYVRRVTKADYIADQSVGAGGGTISNVPLAPDDALELEMDDGSVYVVLAYKRK
jgi:hypothetical protein